jgi:lipid-binding SYLF domain-containing protein
LSSALATVIGFTLGALGGALHLAITRWRASLAITRGAGAALAAMPLGLIGLGALVFAAAKVSPIAAWVTPLGLFAVRLVVLTRVRR